MQHPLQGAGLLQQMILGRPRVTFLLSLDTWHWARDHVHPGPGRRYRKRAGLGNFDPGAVLCYPWSGTEKAPHGATDHRGTPRVRLTPQRFRSSFCYPLPSFQADGGLRQQPLAGPGSGHRAAAQDVAGGM